MIEVVKPGLLDLVMDGGRSGYRSQGVPAGGAADWPALVTANRLVGNPDGLAGLEFLLKGPVLRFKASIVVAIAGAQMDAKINGRLLETGKAHELQAGDVLEIGQAIQGARAYLAVRGGVNVDKVLGSRSTFLPGGFGGWQGRALKAGDVLLAGLLSTPEQQTSRYVLAKGAIRILPGPQIAGFIDEALAALTGGAYRLTADCNRMGLYLDGVQLKYLDEQPGSQGVLPGAIQVPPDGKPIILGWDGPVTGGYPVIGGVVGADLNRLAQLKPGDEIRFVFVSREEAVAAWRDEMGWLQEA